MAVASEQGASSSPAIGIDLGTSFCSAAVYQGGQVKPIPNQKGNYLTPSYVAFTKTNGRLIGEDAKNFATMNPKNTIFGLKSLIGKKIDGPTTIGEQRSFIVLNNDKGSPRILVEEPEGHQATYYLEEILAALLESLKRDAEEYLGVEVTNAVITVPTYFNYNQRRCVQDAATVAGLNVLRIVNEPSAAALGYMFGNFKDSKEVCGIVIFDLGGGGVNTAVASVAKDIVDIFAVGGVSGVGGDTFVNRMVTQFVKQINNPDLAKDSCALARLREACEKSLMSLVKSRKSTETLIQIRDLLPGVDFTGSISQACFEDMIYNDMQRAVESVDNCFRSAGVLKTMISHVVVMGGCGGLLTVKKALEKCFLGGHYQFVWQGRDLETASFTVSGAALVAARAMSSADLQDLYFVDVTTSNWGIKVNRKDNLVVELTMIPSNTGIPAVQTKTVELATGEKDSTSIPIEIYEGSHFLGKMKISGIPLKRSLNTGRSHTCLDVFFELGLTELLVTAKDKVTGKVFKLNVTAELEQSKIEELETMQNNAKGLREEATKRRELLIARNKLQGCCFKIRRELKMENENVWRGRLLEGSREIILGKVGSIMRWMRGNLEGAVKEEIENMLEQIKGCCRLEQAEYLLEEQGGDLEVGIVDNSGGVEPEPKKFNRTYAQVLKSNLRK